MDGELSGSDGGLLVQSTDGTTSRPPPVPIPEGDYLDFRDRDLVVRLSHLKRRSHLNKICRGRLRHR